MAPALSKVAAGSSSQPPKAASEPDCTAKHAYAADCSDKVMAAQWRKRAGRVLFPGVLPVCNGRRQACERPLDGLRSPLRVSTQARNMGTRLSTWHGPLLIAYRTQQLGHYAMSVLCQFQPRATLPPTQA